MRAAMCREHGTVDVVRVEEQDPSPLGPGQARVAVAAAAVNFPDVLQVAGQYQIVVPPPFVPGSEFAGRVTEVADGVGVVSVGDLVAGAGMVGAFAQDVVIDARALRLLPPGTDLHLAAAYGVAHRTAFHVLRSVAKVQPGHELVVLGAGGGVGLAAVQLGAMLGARVTAVASSPEKLEVARKLGATNVIDHRTTELRPALRELVPGGADAVVDPVGGPLAEPALRALGWGGRFVTVGYASGEIPRIPLNLVLLKGIEIHGFEFFGFARRNPEEFTKVEDELLDLFLAGKATPHIGATYPLDQVVEAMREVAEGRAIGKVVIDL